MGSHAGYRADIDGTRAFAVAAVVLYHAGVPGLARGYVGVDVFFVISGFLITGIISREIEGGTFSVLRFYDRRVRRIFPALIAVLAATTLAAWFILIPFEFDQYGKSLLATALFASNFYFLRQSGYFAQGADDRPLLHTWSLSVEEQFYVVFPALLLILYRLGRARAAAIGCALLAVASFVVAEWPVENRSIPFYMLPHRGWELLLGALLALPGVPDLRSERARTAVSLAGLATILFAVAGARPHAHFPGAAALPACIGAAMILYAGRGGTLRTPLTLTPVVGLGKISYSLYLWHWPALCLPAVALDRKLTGLETLAAVALSLALAGLSYRWVEQPFRRPARAGAKAALALGGGAMSAMACLAAAIVVGDGLSWRAPGYVAARPMASALRSRCLVERGAEPAPTGRCLVGAPSAGGYQAVLCGDSHAAHYIEAVDVAAKRAGMTVRVLAKTSCRPLVGAEDGACRAFNQAAAKIARAPEVRTVILAGRWVMYSAAMEVRADPSTVKDTSGGLAQTLGLFADKQVLVLGQAPEFGRDPARCVNRARFVGRSDLDCIRIARSVVDRYAAASARGLAEVTAARPGVRLFQPFAHLCDQDWCYARKDEALLYSDDDHINARASKMLGQFVDLTW